ncbi:MAG TPA: hypothetical protein VMW48_08455 [Vicinamibacterales bacterium]|nr:hypothetical protein [Vicinamibacterales bacterium]
MNGSRRHFRAQAQRALKANPTPQAPFAEDVALVGRVEDVREALLWAYHEKHPTVAMLDRLVADWRRLRAEVSRLSGPCPHCNVPASQPDTLDELVALRSAREVLQARVSVLETVVASVCAQTARVVNGGG